MKKSHYLTRKEVDLLASKFARHTLFKGLKSLTLRVDGYSTSCSLSASDLFYFTLDSLDALFEAKGDDDEDELQYCRDLCFDLERHFQENSHFEGDDLKYAVTLIVCVVYNLLEISGDGRWWREINALREATKSYSAPCRENIEHAIVATLHDSSNSIPLRDWMLDYQRTSKCLSDDIKDAIEELREEGEVADIADEKILVEKLKPFCCGREDYARDFLKRIHGESDDIVIDCIVSYVRNKRMKVSNKSELWDILKKDFYHKTLQTFSNKLKYYLS